MDAPLPLRSPTVPGLSNQLLTATAHNNWTPAVISLTHSLTHSLSLANSSLTSLHWLFLLVTSRHGQRRARCTYVAVQLLLSDSMTYSIVAYVTIGTDCAENTIYLLLFTGRCLVTAGYFVSIILALSEYATVLSFTNRKQLSEENKF
jgi:hypothetical protein